MPTAPPAAGDAAPPPGLRVWLEPGYDGGRVGAWMLDWPGCFTWADDRRKVLADVPSAVAAFVDWLREHGDSAPEPRALDVEIIKEVEPTFSDGYERNATFAADRRAVTDDELEAALRRSGFARADLLAVAGRLDALQPAPVEPIPSAGGAARPADDRAARVPSGPAAPRPTSEVLRHVAGAEVWLASRLDRSQRYEGPDREGDLHAYFDATHRWAVDCVRALHARDPGLEGVDGKGESWTLAKVLRRMLYHGLDHLEELDRRLAGAERRADRLELRRDAPVDLDELLRLQWSAGLQPRAGGRDRLARMLESSTETVSLWDGRALVAFARVLSDETTNAYVSTVVVHPRWQRRGVGLRLMRAVMDGHDDMKFVLETRPGVEGFYRSLGFEVRPTLMARPRSR